MKGFLKNPFANKITNATAVPVPPKIPAKTAPSCLSIYKYSKIATYEFRV